MGGLKARFRLPVDSQTLGWRRELLEEALDFIESNALTASSSLSQLVAGGWLDLERLPNYPPYQKFWEFKV